MVRPEVPVPAAAGGSAAGSGEEDFSGVELSFWTAPFGENDAEFFATHLADWEARTGAKVNVEVIPWDNYEKKYMTGVASGTGPDVGYMYNEMLYNYIESGAIEPAMGVVTLKTPVAFGSANDPVRYLCPIPPDALSSHQGLLKNYYGY